GGDVALSARLESGHDVGRPLGRPRADWGLHAQLPTASKAPHPLPALFGSNPDSAAGNRGNEQVKRLRHPSSPRLQAASSLHLRPTISSAQRLRELPLTHFPLAAKRDTAATSSLGTGIPEPSRRPR